MSDLETMLQALYESRSCPTKFAAGQVLAEGGWSVFPLANMAKKGTDYWFEHSTIDPGKFTAMAEHVMRRHECRDVNVAVTPGKCIVPLLGIDLDGAEAIQSFWDDAQAHGHVDVPIWLRVNTTRPDHGRHLYFVAPDGQGYSNSIHGWGGEVRSIKGHLVMPPSTTEYGTYTWAGEKLYQAPEWVLAKLKKSSHSSRSAVSDSEIDAQLSQLSEHPTNSYGQAVLESVLEELRSSGGRAGHALGGRNATLAKIVNRLLDMALDRDLNALEAIGLVMDVYPTLFTFEEEHKRNTRGEVVRCVRSWARNKDDIPQMLELRDAQLAWAQARSLGSTQVQDYARRLKSEAVDPTTLLAYARDLRRDKDK